MATVHAYAVARGYQTYPKATWRDLAVSLVVSIPALVTPGIIIGGKLFGWFTATESGCIAVLYGAFLALFVYREMDLAGLKYALLDTGKLAGITLFCVGTASVFGWLLAYYQIPRAILSGVDQWGMGPIGTGFFIAGVFLVVGCFLDAIPAIIIVGTILSPMAAAAGLDPVHFAMIGIVSLAFGLVTPPYGLCLLIACSIAGIRMTAALKDTMIMLIPMLAVLALVIVWPGHGPPDPELRRPGVHALGPCRCTVGASMSTSSATSTPSCMRSPISSKGSRPAPPPSPPSAPRSRPRRSATPSCSRRSPASGSRPALLLETAIKRGYDRYHGGGAGRPIAALNVERRGASAE